MHYPLSHKSKFVYNLYIYYRYRIILLSCIHIFINRWIKTIIWRFNYIKFCISCSHIHSHRRRVFQLVAKYPHIAITHTRGYTKFDACFLLGWDGFKCGKYQRVCSHTAVNIVLGTSRPCSRLCEIPLCYNKPIYVFYTICYIRLIRWVLFRLQMLLSSWYILYTSARI